jgi:hypothetical protein
VSACLAIRHPQLTQVAARRARIAGLRILLAALVFIAFAVVPAISWRLQYGVWIR